MITLFHSPGSCSNGILFLLEEAGVNYKIHTVDVRKGDQRHPDFLLQNPKGKVPAMKLDSGEVLTEFQSVAYWVGRSSPDAGLLPAGILEQTRVLEALDFIVGSMHMRGFTFVKMPQKFISDDEGQAKIRTHGRAEVDKALAILSEMLGEKPYLLGDFSIADGALFYVLTWSEDDDFDLPDNLAACLARLRERPSFARIKDGLQRKTAMT